MIGTPTKTNNLRWLIFVPVALLAFFSWALPVKASNPIITAPTDFWFEYEQPTQFIAQTYYIDGFNSDPQLWLYNETGTELITNDDWFGLQSYISIEIPAGKYRLRAGTCCYQPDVWRDGVIWNVQYELSFNGMGSMQTTTQAPTTTSTTTTTVPITTTSTTTTSTTTSTTTTTVVPTTTSSSSTTTTTEQPTTTTTSSPETQTTHQVQTTVLQTTTTVDQTTTTVADDPIVTNPPVTTSVPAPVLSVPSTTSVPVATIPTTTLPEAASSTSVPIQEPPLETPTEIVDNQIIELLTNIDTASQEEIQAVVTEILANEITPEQAVELATSAAVLESVSAEEAQQIFEAIDLGTLEPNQLEELIAVVQNASDTVRESFETAINVFDGKTDTYVPLGSTVPISTRRLVVAVGAMLSAVPTASRKQK
ncbi:hypothetical protein UFOVP1226_17 [uncultured Caudovirales phage]|uniref:Uncharacterized protein n=1 Tax=uncultured Caudovirales phage TaxID=2100421 RepID=A0A6J5LKZ9_9CAUD|nr:hypothetical protein UFOVP278_25 [uncultured Caudovirales phage]CAB4191125.1 hypothetical protein UFOVP1226_17 [uncultured Caudovirales phage]